MSSTEQDDLYINTYTTLGAFVVAFSTLLKSLVGAVVAAFVATNHKMKLALVVGVFFLAGGIANVLMLPSPAWFTALDLLGAYLPMAWLGAKIATKPAQ